MAEKPDVADAHRDGADLASELDGAPPMPDPEAVDLDERAPTAGALYGPAHLDADRERDLLRINRLPSWPNDPGPPGGAEAAHGHGWGRNLDRLLGGGFCPGYVLAVVASRAKAGKTSFLAQLADGLALRTASIVDPEAFGAEPPAGPLSPVLWLSEMGAAPLAWRTLARWTGTASHLFRAGAVTRRTQGEESARAIFDGARSALDNGPLAVARRYVRHLRADHRGKDLLADARAVVDAWRGELARAHPDREVWPVVVVDPIQRWQDHAAGSEVSALNELVETLQSDAERDGWIVLLTSDTQKESAKGRDEKRDAAGDAAAWARGSYKLIHLCDSILTLDRPEDSVRKNATWGDGPEGDPRSMVVRVAVNRWGAEESGSGYASVVYHWHPATGRWRALGTDAEVRKRVGGSETPKGNVPADNDNPHKAKFRR